MNFKIDMMYLLAILITLTALGAAEQRLERRTSVRAALANKLDPNFWPSRGRRNDGTRGSKIDHLELRRQTSDEDGPFWANRGRSLSDLDHFLAIVNNGKENEASLSGRSTESEGPFWANRGRSTDDEGPFWANRGRAIDDEGPFWANRGRATDSEGPFWANRGRSLNSGEDGPFWANRGRRERDEDEERLRRDTLYVDEPGWITMSTSPDKSTSTRRAIFPELAKETDMFWVARGKKLRPKRETGMFLPNNYNFLSSYRNRRANTLNRALQQLKDNQFWPSRGKKDTPNSYQEPKQGSGGSGM